jgi:uncharacterized membrane protein YcaP (DUF421 family)
MDAVVQALVIYLFLLIIFRAAGRRMLAELSTFDFVLLLIISESTQQALLGDDFSVTTALLVITTLIGADVALSFTKSRFPYVGKIVDGAPMILVENGRPLKARMQLARVDEADVLEAARAKQGLERLEQIKFAILEVSGGISIIPFGRKPRTPKKTSKPPKT